MQADSPRHASLTLFTHRRAAQSRDIHEETHLTGQHLYRFIPPAAHHFDSGAYCLNTSDRTTSYRAAYRVFRRASVLTRLGGLTRHQAIWPIGTFYETPGAILPKATPVGRAKYLRGVITYRSLSSLGIRPRLGLLLACIPDKLRGPRRRYCACTIPDALPLAAIADTLHGAAIYRDTGRMHTRHTTTLDGVVVRYCARTYRKL